MRNLVLLSRVDIEDLWVSTGIAFPNPDNIQFYEEFYLKNKDKIESQEVLDRIGDPLDYESSDYEDKSFKFKKTYYKYKIYFVYENESGEEIELSFQMDNINLMD
jgi:hypothetical protein